MATTNRTDDWFPRLNSSQYPHVRLVCFAFAGGSASAFASWGRSLPKGTELRALQLPGRSSRLREQPISRMDALIPLLREAIDPLLDAPLVFFGHSNGALIAHELAHVLSRESVGELKHIVISSEEAPHARRATCRHQLSDAELLEELQSFGGTPTSVLRHREFMMQMLPALRADFAVSETHTFSNVNPLHVPVSLWWGRDDRIVAWPDVEAWQKCFAEPARIRVFNGGHFYFNDSRTEVLQALSDVLTSVADTDSVGYLQPSYQAI